MSQNDFVIDNQTFPNTRADLNSAFQALASMSIGPNEPPVLYAGQAWFDSTNNLLRIRNGSNSAWIDWASVDATNNRLEFRANVVQSVSAGGVKLKDDSGNDMLTVTASGAGFAGDITVTNADPSIVLSDTSDGKKTRAIQNGNKFFVASDSPVTFTDYAGSGDVTGRPTVREGGADRKIILDSDGATQSAKGLVKYATTFELGVLKNPLLVSTLPITSVVGGDDIKDIVVNNSGWIEIETRAISGGETAIDFTGLSYWRDIRVIPIDVVFSASHALLGLVSTDSGSTWVTSGYAGGVWDDYSGYAPTSYMRFRDGTHTKVPVGVLDFLRISDSGPTYVTGLLEQQKINYRTPAGSHNALRLYLSADTFTSGSFLLMGRR